MSRTETLRAYREATRRNYAANADVVEGWIWHATLSVRTCPACFAMHGTFHELTETMAAHPNCRCTPVPAVKPWKALGYDIPDNRPVIESGETAFARLTAQEQERVLGKAAFAAYRGGAVSLSDFAGWRHSDDWGTTLARRSLREMVGREEAQRWIEQARTRSRIVAAMSQAPTTTKGLAQIDRLVEMRMMRQGDVRALLESIRQERNLPAIERHFLKHGMKLGLVDVEEYQDALIAHLERRDLRVFTYVTSKATQDRMWTFVGMDNGAIVQYNESKKTLWSLYQQADVQKYLASGRGWWVQIREDEAGIRFEPW